VDGVYACPAAAAVLDSNRERSVPKAGMVEEADEHARLP
jgi:hypothetical protein